MYSIILNLSRDYQNTLSMILQECKIQIRQGNIGLHTHARPPPPRPCDALLNMAAWELMEPGVVEL